MIHQLEIRSVTKKKTMLIAVMMVVIVAYLAMMKHQNVDVLSPVR